MAIPWKDVINNMQVEDLPSDGKSAPDIEFLAVEEKIKSGKVFVQKLVTEVYIYTDTDNYVQGQTTFQTSTLLGQMSPKELAKMIRDEKRSRAKDT